MIVVLIVVLIVVAVPVLAGAFMKVGGRERPVYGGSAFLDADPVNVASEVPTEIPDAAIGYPVPCDTCGEPIIWFDDVGVWVHGPAPIQTLSPPPLDHVAIPGRRR